MDLPELSVDPLSIGVRNTAQAVQTQGALQENQLRSALMPDQIAAAHLQLQNQTAMAPLELDAAKRRDAAETVDTGNKSIAQVAMEAQAADPEDAPKIWDDGMKDAAAKGVTQATQYVGHYRPDLAERVGDIYSGQKPAQPANPMADPTQVARAVAQMPIPQVQKALGNLNRTISSFNSVKDQQSWDSEIQSLKDAGINPDRFLPNLDWNPLNYAAATRVIQGLVPMRDAMAQRMAAVTVGGPTVAPPNQYEPNFTMIGTDPQTGRPIYHDTRTNAETMGASPIGPKPNAASNTFNLKRAAYLETHPGDDTGALEFANGKRNMSPAQMQESALNQANKQLADATLAGQQINDPDAYVRQHTAENYKLISGATSPASHAPAGNGGGGLPQRAVDALKKANGAAVRFQNNQVWKMGPNGKPVRVS